MILKLCVVVLFATASINAFDIANTFCTIVCGNQEKALHVTTVKPNKLKCLAPTILFDVSETHMLKKCFSSDKEDDNEDCYWGLGCFSHKSPWTGPLRPVPKPKEPMEIGVSMQYFSRSMPNGENVTLWPRIDFKNIDYNAKRERTVFITHGYAGSRQNEWLTDMKDALLKKMDANIFMVDWGEGAKTINYFQAVANTRVVGAEIGRLLQYLVSEGLKIKKIHLIGFSLGAHLMSYAANHINDNKSKVGRITGLDPAGPAYEGQAEEVRLDKGDGNFVEIIHTNARLFLLGGLGMLRPAGHVDFYMNGGDGQPGCVRNGFDKKIESLKDFGELKFEALKYVTCNHRRSHQYFISALNNTKCGFIARLISDFEKFGNLLTLGKTAGIADLISKQKNPCTVETCTIMGMESEHLPLRGNFEVPTTSKAPYCDDSEKYQVLRRRLVKMIR